MKTITSTLMGLALLLTLSVNAFAGDCCSEKECCKKDAPCCKNHKK
jgi:hypothetical protein